MLLAKAEGNHVPVVGLEGKAAVNRALEDLAVDSVLAVKEVAGPEEVKVAANHALEVLVAGSDQGVKGVSGPVAVLEGKVAGQFPSPDNHPLFQARKEEKFVFWRNLIRPEFSLRLGGPVAYSRA